MRNAAIWCRVSITEQENGNELIAPREWAARRGLTVMNECQVEASAWTGRQPRSHARPARCLLRTDAQHDSPLGRADRARRRFTIDKNFHISAHCGSPRWTGQVRDQVPAADGE
jgi:hypothetical protein